MNDEQCRDYLKSLERFGIKLGLDNIHTLLEALGRPHRAFPSILIAGTNGKGSVAAMLTRILSENGFRTGLYTSPHLVRIEERIRIGERLITPGEFRRGLSRLKETVDGLLASGHLKTPPTFFEVLTALAISHFARKKVDVAVLEVGMGGRFDATNAVTPLVSVITTIAKDHQEYLGPTLSRIAYEKAGIIKPGVPVVCGVGRGTAFRVIRARARELGSPFIEALGQGTALEPTAGPGGYRFRYASPAARYSFRPSLPGLHQGRNAAVAIRTAEVLAAIWRPLDGKSFARAVRNTCWEGRLEVVAKCPPVILDGAHNAEGAAALGVYIRDILRKPVILVFDAMKDKEVRKMADQLFPLAGKIILTQIPMRRALSPEDVRSLSRESWDRIVIEPDVARALELARREGRPGTPVVVAGSLFLVGEVKRILGSGKTPRVAF